MRDLSWIALFFVFGLCIEEFDYPAYIVLALFAIFQFIEAHVPALTSERGIVVSVLIKTVLCYLLVGYTDSINSPAYVIFLIPIVTAATEFGLLGTIGIAILCCVAYASFLFFVDWDLQYIDAFEWKVLYLRLYFFPLVALVVYEQARARRREMDRTRAAAEQLAESNRTLRLTQASLHRSQRLAALGQLTAGLAHELRNPLGTIKASSEMLERPSTQSNPEIVRELSGYISSEVDRTNALVSRFLDFARPLALTPKRASLRDTLNGAITQAQARADANGVLLKSSLSPEIDGACFDPELLSVAVVNLLQNAIDASAASTTVTLSAKFVGEGCSISVADQGSGIAPQHLENIFNPFFTTKISGTGLGLALVAKIVDEHGGRVSVHSEVGKGTTFDIFLPEMPEHTNASENPCR